MPFAHLQGSAKKKKKCNNVHSLCKQPYAIQDGDMIGCFPTREKTVWNGDIYQTELDKDFKATFLSQKRQQ